MHWPEEKCSSEKLVLGRVKCQREEKRGGLGLMLCRLAVGARQR